MDSFSSKQVVAIVSRRLELLDEEEESSLCLALRQSELAFSAIEPISKSLKVEGKNEVSLPGRKIVPVRFLCEK